MFELGFFGTSAPLYMDVITLYFALLPFLMAFGIYMALKKKFELHFKMQMATYMITLLIVILFEVGVRLSGGFSFFMQHSHVNYNFMIIFLLIHIIIAFVSVSAYSLLIYSSIREFRLKKEALIKNHKKFGMLVYLGMSLTSITGVMIYYFLFIY